MMAQNGDAGLGEAKQTNTEAHKRDRGDRAAKDRRNKRKTKWTGEK